MPRKNSTDKLKGRRVKKGTPRTKPSAKESARANKVQDKPKGTKGTRANSTPANRPGRQSNTGKMEGASGTRNATDKGKTAKKITNSRAAKTKAQLKANRVKQEKMTPNKKPKVPSKLAKTIRGVARRAGGVATGALSVAEEAKKSEAAARRKAYTRATGKKSST